MTIITKQLGLDDAAEGMILSDDLIDLKGQILLPKGVALTQRTIASLRRHEITSVRIIVGEMSAEEDAAQRVRFQVRIDHLFRKLDGTDASGALLNLIRSYRLGASQ